MNLLLAVVDAVEALGMRPLLPGGAVYYDWRVSGRVVSCSCARCGWRATLFWPVRRMALHVERRCRQTGSPW